MEHLLETIIHQSENYALIAVALISFFESLALVGLLLPGTFLMTGLGALIGSGSLNLWLAWFIGSLACLLGDWISFGLGWHFKSVLNRWSVIKKNKSLLDKTQYALHKHSLSTILIGRFVGPTRPVIPMMAGMLNMPVSRFILPNLLACILWPPVYFLPGILAGAAIDIPANAPSGSFKVLLFISTLTVWLTAWFGWRLWRGKKLAANKLTHFLHHQRLVWLAPLSLAAAVGCVYLLISHPLMPAYLDILHQIIGY